MITGVRPAEGAGSAPFGVEGRGVGCDVGPGWRQSGPDGGPGGSGGPSSLRLGLAL